MPELTSGCSTSLQSPMRARAFVRGWKMPERAARGRRAGSLRSLRPGSIRSMAYLVSLTARAQRDLFALYQYIQAEDSSAADLRYRGLKRAIFSLERFPHRCTV